MTLKKTISQSNTTFAKVSFFRSDEPSFSARVDAFDPLAFRGFGNSSLVGFTFSKSLSQPCGSVEITLTESCRHGIYEGIPWSQLVKEGDYWGIDIVKNGVEIGLSMGRVDLVNVRFCAAQVCPSLAGLVPTSAGVRGRG